MKPLRIAVRSFSDFEAALKAQLATYRASASHPVVVGTFDLAGLEKIVLGGELSSGDWDLVIFPTDWIGSAIRNRALEHLEPWMQRQPLPDWPDGWPASLREPLRQQDGFYCIPWHDGPECLIYRKDLFEDALERAAFVARYGRELAPPESWSEFHEIARFFTRPDQGLWGTLFAAFPDGHNTLYDLVLQVWSRGGELFDTEGQPTLDHPAVIKALDFYRTIIRDGGACYPGAVDIDSVSSGDVFLTGQIAMMVNWFGFAARANLSGSALCGKLALAAIPGGATLSNYWVIAIAAGSQAKADAYSLLCHIASAENDKQTSLHGAVGVRLSTWQDRDVVARVSFYASLPELSAKARTLPFCEDLPRLATIINEVAVAALTTEEPSESILVRAQLKAVEQGLRLS